jgi:VanZ family protein
MLMRMKSLKRTHAIALWGVVVAALCAFIWFMSSRTGGDSGGMSEQVADAVARVIVPGYAGGTAAERARVVAAMQLPIRKTGHFLEYAALGAAVCCLLRAIDRWPRSSAGRLAAAWGLAVVFAATDEVHQLFVPGREGKPTDVLIDAAGVLAGVAVVHLLTSLRQKGLTVSARAVDAD